MDYDAVIIGSGPNGLAAAITLAREGLSVLVIEGANTPGGGARSAELTLPGYLHDVCSAVFPLGIASPFFRQLPLAGHGLKWIEPEAPLAHPFEDGRVAVLERSIASTGRGLGPDAAAYTRLLEPLATRWEALLDDVLAPPHFPRHPVLLARFGIAGMRSAQVLVEKRFQDGPARALLGGLAAHSFLPLDASFTSAFGLLLGSLGHAVGWPFAAGGAGNLTNALVACLRSHGGAIASNWRIRTAAELPRARVWIFDTTPRQLVQIAGDLLPARYQRALGRFRYGPAAFKVDWALDGPIPWKSAECCRAGTLHLGGSFEQIAAAERAVWEGLVPERPFVLVAQPSLFDPSRAPPGKHTAWAYCHVPNRCSADLTERIEMQVERFAPGFRECILARHVASPAQLETHNPNYIGGDISGGANAWHQLFARPVWRWIPYATPARGIYLCSASTPPGAGVHGMCGFQAAQAVLRDLFRQSSRESQSPVAMPVCGRTL